GLAGAGREEGAVVVVRARRGAHEHDRAGAVDHGREPEHVLVEATVGLRVTDVQHGVVHAADHEATSTGVFTSPARNAASWRRHSTEALSDWTLTVSVRPSGKVPVTCSSMMRSSSPIARSKAMTACPSTEKSSLRHTTNVKYERASSSG